MAEKRVALARIGHSAITWCSFLSWQKRKQRKYWRIMGNSSHITRCFESNLMHHYTSEVNQACWALSEPLSGFSWPDVRTAGNETDHAHEIWQERLLAWNIFLQAIGRIKEFEIMVAVFVWAVSSSTHFSFSDQCQWRWCAMYIITYSFKYNNYNNKNTFLSP